MGRVPFKSQAVNSAATILAWPIARYIRTQRDRLAVAGYPLSHSWKQRLGPYFDEVDLERVRVIEADPLPIPSPPFALIIRRMGISFPEPSLVSGITLDHVIAIRESPTASLLFHELVHVVQYRLLGVKAFSRLYVGGFLGTRSYDGIPLERCAFDLEARFATEQAPFAVAAAVQKWINSERE